MTWWYVKWFLVADWSLPFGRSLADVFVEVIECVRLVAGEGTFLGDARSRVLTEPGLIWTEETEKEEKDIRAVDLLPQ